MSGYRPDNGFDGLMARVRQELKEAGQPKPATAPIPAPQNMKTVEEPKLEAEDVGAEDYSEEDLNSTPAKPAPKSQSKDDDRYAVKEVPDKAVQNPAPAKESKGHLLLCNNCFKTCRNTEDICTECRSNMVERIVEDSKPPFACKEGGLTPGLKDADVLRKYTASVAQVGEDKAIQQTAQDLDLSPDEVQRIVGASKAEVTEGEVRTEEIANVILHALQDFGGYWHTETQTSAAGNHYEFISTDFPKVKAYIEKADTELPEESVKEHEAGMAQDYYVKQIVADIVKQARHGRPVTHQLVQDRIVYHLMDVVMGKLEGEGVHLSHE